MKSNLTILLLLINSVVFSQDRSNFGFGAVIGYKTAVGDGGIIAEYKFKNRFNIYMGLTYADFNGLGYVIGADVFITNYKWQPCLGIAFNRQSGDYFYSGDTTELKTDYIVNANNNYIATIGVRKILMFDKIDAIGFMAFTPFLSYRFTFPENKVIFTDGYINEAREERINTRIGGGFGGGLKMVYFFHRSSSK